MLYTQGARGVRTSELHPVCVFFCVPPASHTTPYLAAAPDVVLHLAVAVAGADVHLGSQHLLDVLLPDGAAIHERDDKNEHAEI